MRAHDDVELPHVATSNDGEFTSYIKHLQMATLFRSFSGLKRCFSRLVLNKYDNYKCLVGGLEHFLLSIIYGIILPIDSLTFIFLKMVIAPPTRCSAANHSLWTEGDHHDAQQVRYQWTARE